jgi:hypothetical protein
VYIEPDLVFEPSAQVLEFEKNLSKRKLHGLEIWKTKLKLAPKEHNHKKTCVETRTKGFFQKGESTLVLGWFGISFWTYDSSFGLGCNIQLLSSMM